MPVDMVGDLGERAQLFQANGLAEAGQSFLAGR
jgi:hypothetical protein